MFGMAGHANAAGSAGAAYGPPPPPAPGVPGGFSAVVTSVTVGPGGGTVGPLTVDGAGVAVSVPAGAFPGSVQITIFRPSLPGAAVLHGFVPVAGLGVQVSINGVAYPGTFLKPITVSIRSSRISAASVVQVWNGSAFVTDTSASTGTGRATVSFDSDPDFVVQSPGGAREEPGEIPGATAAVTGEPFAGEGLLAGALLLAGSGGLAVSRRRRDRA